MLGKVLLHTFISSSCFGHAVTCRAAFCNRNRRNESGGPHLCPKRFARDRIYVERAKQTTTAANQTTTAYREHNSTSHAPQRKVYTNWGIPVERERPELVACAGDIRRALEKRDGREQGASVQLLDARAAEQFTGELSVLFIFVLRTVPGAASM